MPGPHQITTRVLARPDQITRRLLIRLRHMHRDQLTQPQQPRQPLRVTTIRLHFVPGSPPDPRRRRNQTADPRRRHTPSPTHTPSARPHTQPAPAPGNDFNQPTVSPLSGETRTVRSSPVGPSKTAATVERACTSNPTHVTSPITAPPVIAALPPRQSRRQPAPTYERGAGNSIWSGSKRGPPNQVRRGLRTGSRP